MPPTRATWPPKSDVSNVYMLGINEAKPHALASSLKWWETPTHEVMLKHATGLKRLKQQEQRLLLPTQTCPKYLELLGLSNISTTRSWIESAEWNHKQNYVQEAGGILIFSGDTGNGVRRISYRAQNFRNQRRSRPVRSPKFHSGFQTPDGIETANGITPTIPAVGLAWQNTSDPAVLAQKVLYRTGWPSTATFSSPRESSKDRRSLPF